MFLGLVTRRNTPTRSTQLEMSCNFVDVLVVGNWCTRHQPELENLHFTQLERSLGPIPSSPSAYFRTCPPVQTKGRNKIIRTSALSNENQSWPIVIALAKPTGKQAEGTLTGREKQMSIHSGSHCNHKPLLYPPISSSKWFFVRLYRVLVSAK